MTPICFEVNLAAVFFNLASSFKLAPKHFRSKGL